MRSVEEHGQHGEEIMIALCGVVLMSPGIIRQEMPKCVTGARLSMSITIMNDSNASEDHHGERGII